MTIGDVIDKYPLGFTLLFIVFCIAISEIGSPHKKEKEE